MADYTQTDRPLQITTPLGPDILLLTGFTAQEEISHLFHVHADLIAGLDKDVKFDKIIGQSVTVEMRLLDNSKRYFNGIVNRFSQGQRDENFLHFEAEIVPKFWFLTKKVRSRVFQHLTIPDILKQLLTGLDVSYEIQGTYYPRDFSVQYRESDFAYASRLMEEEGIYYFFKHSDGNHQLVVTDIPNKHPAVQGQTSAVYEELSADLRTDMRVTGWKKIQELRAGEITLWDHCFELPGNHLEAKEKTIDSVAVGKVNHKLNLANETLELYDFPGAYAQRFDGIDPAGGARPADIQHIFEDRTRTVRLRMEQEEVLGIRIKGKSACGQFTAGHKFTLERHFDADASYLLTRVKHEARDESYRSETPDPNALTYKNRFTCIPETLRFRPQRKTPKPVIAGMQTATVVGPPGEEIFVDKYGRVKVQFHWDREGKLDANSSCWLRVAQIWAGKGWGAFFWPRIGHEVVVTFEEGDPDQPLITGSVYNADNMPWFKLPLNKKLGGFKSHSVKGAASKNYNGIIFNDENGKEHLSIHSEHNLSLNSEKDKMIHSGRHKGERVAVANVYTVGKLIPRGGGSGGAASYNEGDPIPEPPPTGVLGISSTVTYGDNLQGACPLNHQLVFGNNVQLCVNPFGLVAGLDGQQAPKVMQAIMGGGMGGNMQFTVGTSAQFTLGQSYEISIGPPKIEIHTGYDGHVLISSLCILLGAVAAAFLFAYDSLLPKEYTPPGDPAEADADKGSEQTGDKQRAAAALIYQATSDVLMMAILALESMKDKLDWASDDMQKQLFDADKGFLSAYNPKHLKKKAAAVDGNSWWNDISALAVGSVELAALIAVGIEAESE